MKTIDMTPVISHIIVKVEGLEYKDTTCTVEIQCNVSGAKFGEGISARCEEPFFVMGQGFWKEEFGAFQANRMKKLCKEAYEDFIADNDFE